MERSPPEGSPLTYGKFVIVSYLRSGTHLLRTALESHPAVICQAEPFNSDDRRLPYALTTPTAEVLAGWVFRDDFPATVGAAGFVLQAYHPNALAAFPGIRANPVWRDVWPRLAGMDDLRVLHLERRDLLARHLSHRMARTTGFWHSWEPSAVDRVTHLTGRPPAEQIGNRPPQRPRLVIEPAQLELDLAEVTRWHRAADAALAGRPILHLAYEELCGEFANVCRRVEDFLGLERMPLRPAVAKLEERTPRQAIANYDELALHFAGSPWESLFDR